MFRKSPRGSVTLDASLVNQLTIVPFQLLMHFCRTWLKSGLSSPSRGVNPGELQVYTQATLPDLLFFSLLFFLLFFFATTRSL